MADNAFFDNMERGSGALLALLSNAFVYQLHLTHFWVRAFDPETIWLPGCDQPRPGPVLCDRPAAPRRRGLRPEPRWTDDDARCSTVSAIAPAVLFRRGWSLWIRWRTWERHGAGCPPDGFVLACSSWTTLLSMASERTCSSSPEPRTRAMLASCRPGLTIAAIGASRSAPALPARQSLHRPHDTARQLLSLGTPSLASPPSAERIRSGRRSPGTPRSTPCPGARMDEQDRQGRCRPRCRGPPPHRRSQGLQYLQGSPVLRRSGVPDPGSPDVSAFRPPREALPGKAWA